MREYEQRTERLQTGPGLRNPVSSERYHRSVRLRNGVKRGCGRGQLCRRLNALPCHRTGNGSWGKGRCSFDVD